MTVVFCYTFFAKTWKKEIGYKKWNCHSVETLAKDLLFAIPKQLSSHVRVSKNISPPLKKRNVKWHKYCLKDLPGRRFIYMPVLCPAGLPLRRHSKEWCNDMQSLEMIKMWQALFSTEALLIHCVCRHRRSSRQPYSGILYFVLLPVNWKEENDKARIYSFDHRDTICSPPRETATGRLPEMGRRHIKSLLAATFLQCSTSYTTCVLL